MRIPAALGLDPTIANAGEELYLRFEFCCSCMKIFGALSFEYFLCNFSGFAVHQAINDAVGTILPERLQRSILDGIFSIGRAQLSDSVLNEKNPLGSLRLYKLRRIFDEGNSLQLQFPAEDLGFRWSFYFIY